MSSECQIKSGYRTPEEKSLETLPENRKRRCRSEVSREVIPQTGGIDWKSIYGSEVER